MKEQVTSRFGIKGGLQLGPSPAATDGVDDLEAGIWVFAEDLSYLSGVVRLCLQADTLELVAITTGKDVANGAVDRERVALSIFVPDLIAPLAHGVPMTDAGDGLFAGARQFKFMRALFGLSVSTVLGVVVALFTKPEPEERIRGLVWGTVSTALERYKGKPGNELSSARAPALPRKVDLPEADDRPPVRLSTALARQIQAEIGDLVYITDRRWWFGGLHSVHATVAEIFEDDAPIVEMGQDPHEVVVTKGRDAEPVIVDRLY